MVYNKRSGKPRGYAFIEYEHERDMHCEYPPPQHPFPPYNRMSILLTTTVRSLGSSRAHAPQVSTAGGRTYRRPRLQVAKL